MPCAYPLIEERQRRRTRSTILPVSYNRLRRHSTVSRFLHRYRQPHYSPHGSTLPRQSVSLSYRTSGNRPCHHNGHHHPCRHRQHPPHRMGVTSDSDPVATGRVEVVVGEMASLSRPHPMRFSSHPPPPHLPPPQHPPHRPVRVAPSSAPVLSRPPHCVSRR